MATVRNAAKSVKENTNEAFETVETLSVNGANVVRDQVQRSMDAFRGFSDLARENVEAFTASANTATKGIEALNARAVAFSKTSIETSMEAARALSGVKSVHEAIELQTDFARTAFETYVKEVNALTGLMSAMVKDSIRPLNERGSAYVNFMQSQR
jgi:phasin family protein